MTKLISSTAIATLTVTLFSSCATKDPEYVEWQRQKAAQNGGSTDSNNPYSVPGLNGETGDIGQPNITGNAPYQPLPDVPDSNTYSQPDISPSYSDINDDVNLPAGGSVKYIVEPGDSLWALSRKYNTSVDAIKEANNLTSDNIWVGQKLTIISN